jgi:LysM repeat protein
MIEEEPIEAALRNRPSDEPAYLEPLTPLVYGRHTWRARRAGRAPTRKAALALGCVALMVAAVAAYPIITGSKVNNPVIGGPSTPPTSSASSFGTTGVWPETGGPPTVTPVPQTQQYVVQKGDTLARIAARFNLQIWELEVANPNIKDPNHIEVGWRLSIPPAGVLTPPPPGAAAS